MLCVNRLTCVYIPYRQIKCEHYWPTKEEDAMHCRDIVVTLEVAQQYAYYDYRSITITKDVCIFNFYNISYFHQNSKLLITG